MGEACQQGFSPAGSRQCTVWRAFAHYLYKMSFGIKPIAPCTGLAANRVRGLVGVRRVSSGPSCGSGVWQAYMHWQGTPVYSLEVMLSMPPPAIPGWIHVPIPLSRRGIRRVQHRRSRRRSRPVTILRRAQTRSPCRLHARELMRRDIRRCRAHQWHQGCPQGWGRRWYNHGKLIVSHDRGLLLYTRASAHSPSNVSCVPF